MTTVPNPRAKWDEWEPQPLPDDIAAMFAEAAEYADRIAQGEKELDAQSMRVAAALTALYESDVWVAEMMELQPPRKDAVGRPPVPNSRNRFVKWMGERAKKTGHQPLGSVYVYRLIDAHGYFAHGQNNYGWTEYTLRPLKWLTKNGPKPGETFTGSIPEVERIAINIAGSPDKVTNKVMSQAVAQFKKDNGWSRADDNRSRAEQKAKRYAVQLNTLFDDVLINDFDAAREFIKDAYAKIQAAAKQAA
jgi:hypothetical protein